MSKITDIGVNINPATEILLNEEYASPEGTNEPTKLYEFRKLNSTDLFPMIKIISKIGINELTQVFDSSSLKDLIKNTKAGATDVDKDLEEETKEEKSEFIVGVSIALEIANKILERLPVCENEIYTLLSRVSNMAIEDVKALDIDVFFEMIVDFIMKEEFKGFIRVASKLVK